jgi:hypothetical protein
MRRRFGLTAAAILAGGALVVLALGSFALAGGGTNNVHENLVGYEEVPAVSTVAGGSFEAKIDDSAGTIEYTLAYDGLEGSVTQAHIHVGQASVNGGVSAFLCGTAATPGPPGTPVCPASGSVSGTIDASDVIGPAGQGVSPGEFAELVAAIRAQATYANVHSTKWPGGEIRAQLNSQPNDG